MRGVADREGDTKLFQVGIAPVALMQECSLALGEGTDLIVIAAVEQDLLVGILEQQLQVLGILQEAGLVKLT